MNKLLCYACLQVHPARGVQTVGWGKALLCCHQGRKKTDLTVRLREDIFQIWELAAIRIFFAKKQFMNSSYRYTTYAYAYLSLHPYTNCCQHRHGIWMRYNLRQRPRHGKVWGRHSIGIWFWPTGVSKYSCTIVHLSQMGDHHNVLHDVTPPSPHTQLD